MFYIAQMH